MPLGASLSISKPLHVLLSRSSASRFSHAALCALAVSGLLLAGGASAQAATVPPSLDGERFVGGDPVYLDGQGPTNAGDLPSECNPSGNSTVTYTSSGTAYGPYPGAFTATVTATVGPQTAGGYQGGPIGGATPGGQLVSLHESFTIHSPNGTVSGTKDLTAAANSSGACAALTTPDGSTVGIPFFGQTRLSVERVRANVGYSATIRPATGGTYRDSGTGTVNSLDLRIVGICVASGEGFCFNRQIGDGYDGRSDLYEQYFYNPSGQPTPLLPTSADQCKNGGWQAFGVFKNQGDCVSFVATGGKNPPAGA